MMFACPSTCQDYQENGLRLERSYRDRHKALCHADNVSAFLRCIVRSDCTAKFERTLFTPPGLEKHLQEEHGGLEGLCNPKETTRLGGRLAVRFVLHILNGISLVAHGLKLKRQFGAFQLNPHFCFWSCTFGPFLSTNDTSHLSSDTTQYYLL